MSLRCKCCHVNTIENPINDNVVLTYSTAFVIGGISFLGYDADCSGCFCIEEVDDITLSCIPKDKGECPIRIMVFDGAGVQKDIGEIDIYQKGDKIKITDIESNMLYQFCMRGVKIEKKDHTGESQNPITGRWSFL